MASDVTLFIVDPRLGTMVCARWLGMSATLAKIREVLGRPAEHSAPGKEAWADISAAQAVLIAEAHYEGGPRPSEIAVLEKRFPPPLFWWIIERDY